ncbi:MAG: DUF4345 domain-containing protein [Roseovarius sp.]
MTLSLFEKLTLGLAGTTALGIGTAILAAPQEFYASYGIEIAGDASLLSELRAPGAGLAAWGGLMLAGVWRGGLQQVAIVAALTVFLAFPAGRVAGLLLDGTPAPGILAALALELAIAALLMAAFRHRLRPEGGQRRHARA